ncbi:MAG: hypothetical protein ABL998_20495 [Planctomycetota bacterium]
MAILFTVNEPKPSPIPYEVFVEEVRRLEAERWVAILDAERPGRVPGRRPRDPEKEALLAELDRLRIEKSELLKSARRIPPRET